MEIGCREGNRHGANVIGVISLALLRVGVGEEENVVVTGGDARYSQFGGVSIGCAGGKRDTVGLVDGADGDIGAVQKCVGG